MGKYPLVRIKKNWRMTEWMDEWLRTGWDSKRRAGVSYLASVDGVPIPRALKSAAASVCLRAWFLRREPSLLTDEEFLRGFTWLYLLILRKRKEGRKMRKKILKDKGDSIMRSIIEENERGGRAWRRWSNAEQWFLNESCKLREPKPVQELLVTTRVPPSHLKGWVTTTQGAWNEMIQERNEDHTQQWKERGPWKASWRKAPFQSALACA